MHSNDSQIAIAVGSQTSKLHLEITSWKRRLSSFMVGLLEFLSPMPWLLSEKEGRTLALPELSVPGKLPRVVRGDHHGNVGAIRQQQRFENPARMVHVVVKCQSQDSRTLQLSIHKHTDGRRAGAVFVHAAFARDVLHPRVSGHTACLAAGDVAR